MRTLILGGTGMLGRAVLAAARARGWPALALSRRQADVADEARLDYWMAAFSPEVVVNCAAYTRVDDCETQQEHAMAVNGEAVGRVRLVQVSTDYVFDGRAGSPYGEEAPVGPLSVYGASKLAGEQRALAFPRALAVRTSWVFGPGGASFPATIAGAIARGQRQLRVVDDQQGAPTYSPFLARALLDLAQLGATGIVHYRNRPAVTWYAFAQEIARCWPRAAVAASPPGGPRPAPSAPPDIEVLPVPTAEVPRPAPRPAYSVLAVDRCEALLGRRVEPWLGGLVEYLTAIRQGGDR